MLKEILEWVDKRSAPNEAYRYSRCVICGHAWWDNHEEHNFDCWVPCLRRAVEQGLHLTGGILSSSEPLSPLEPGTGVEYLSHQPTSK